MMTVKRRILAIKIIEKSKKYPEVLKKTWGKGKNERKDSYK